MSTIVFDMDGILFDTERLCFESWCAVGKEYGICDMEQFFPLCIGRNEAGSGELVLAHYGEDFPYKEFRKKTSAWFHKQIEQNGLPIMKGAPELLEELTRHRWKIGLASSTRYESVMAHLEQSGLRNFFSTVVTGDMVEYSKPQPDIYLMACEHLGATPAECFAVEDSPNGIRAAYHAGMKPIMVPDMISPDEEIRPLCHKICNNLWEVQSYLLSAIFT